MIYVNYTWTIRLQLQTDEIHINSTRKKRKKKRYFQYVQIFFSSFSFFWRCICCCFRFPVRFWSCQCIYGFLIVQFSYQYKVLGSMSRGYLLHHTINIWMEENERNDQEREKKEWKKKQNQQFMTVFRFRRTAIATTTYMRYCMSASSTADMNVC